MKVIVTLLVAVRIGLSGAVGFAQQETPLWVVPNYPNWPLIAPEQRPIAETVWDLEQTYWRTLAEGDLDAHRVLWHPNAVGWPNLLSTPANAEVIMALSAGFVEAIVPESGEFVIDPDTFAVAFLPDTDADDIVIVHYQIMVTAEFKDGSDFALYDRYSHTWWLDPTDGWKIIGGNSFPVDALIPAE